MHLGIVGGNDAGEEDGDEPDAEQDGAEPLPDISGGEIIRISVMTYLQSAIFAL